ncbi:MAG: phosphoribosyl-AMP cyclohydrolase [Candidatus Promineifilaceae bacterium]|nr:phosphoribosyl-AMP cyclohydrolase [Candidatus Promineifilaceae bacterium]
MKTINELRFSDQGLIPAIVQDANSLAVLMMAWMNKEALKLTLSTGELHFWSRSRQEIWHKGATSGNIMILQEFFYDCDGDTLLALVNPAGPACHTGKTSCFFRNLSEEIENLS